MTRAGGRGAPSGAPGACSDWVAPQVLGGIFADLQHPRLMAAARLPGVAVEGVERWAARWKPSRPSGSAQAKIADTPGTSDIRAASVMV